VSTKRKELDTRTLDFSGAEHTKEASKKMSLSLANRARFRTNPLWVECTEEEEEAESRASSNHGVRLPWHANETMSSKNETMSGMSSKKGARMTQTGHSPRETKRDTCRGEIRFMASSPTNNDASKPRDQPTFQVERTGQFMRASCRLAPDGDFANKMVAHRIVVKSLAVPNNPI